MSVIMSRKKIKEARVEEEVRKGQRYLRDTPRQYWIRSALITLGLFALVLWLNYPTRGASAFLWAFGIAGLILGYFVVSYLMFRR